MGGRTGYRGGAGAAAYMISGSQNFVVKISSTIERRLSGKLRLYLVSFS